MTPKKGFTLVELLVVIAIIGLLSTLSVIALGSARQKARDALRLSHIKQIQTALEFYFSDYNNYPVGQELVLGLAGGACLDETGFTSAETCANPYMGSVPPNPAPGGADYIYSQTADGAGYQLIFNLEDDSGGLSAGQRQATQEGIN
ncbi:MAG TPA: prepilin-type N-terminal cleavage/methylation domain-containing protein [Patescibacteria group bacterium]